MLEIVIPWSHVIWCVAGYVALGVLALLGGLAMGGEEQRVIDEFPPISDEEFVKLCRPGTDPKIALRVRRLLADYIGRPVESIHPDMSLTNDLFLE